VSPDGAPELGAVTPPLDRGALTRTRQGEDTGLIYVSSGFGPRIDPVTKLAHNHDGIDLPTPIGSPVFASYPGTVARVDADGIDRGLVNGNAVHVTGPPGWRWSYLHLSRPIVVAGQAVELGQLLGYSGTTGRSTGPHLHFQVTVNGAAIDPRPLFPGVFYGP
jgi:murein DD-endopeptidase MepM/ murein hydrolase activator NlpD